MNLQNLSSCFKVLCMGGMPDMLARVGALRVHGAVVREQPDGARVQAALAQEEPGPLLRVAHRALPACCADRCPKPNRDLV